MGVDHSAMRLLDNGLLARQFGNGPKVRQNQIACHLMKPELLFDCDYMT